MYFSPYVISFSSKISYFGSSNGPNFSPLIVYEANEPCGMVIKGISEKPSLTHPSITSCVIRYLAVIIDCFSYSTFCVSST